MSYSAQEILEKLIEYKKKHGHYPTRSDFKNKNGLPSKNTIYRQFGTIENAVKQAVLFERGELNVEEVERKSIKPISKKGGFRCPFCGNYTSNAEKYYSSLTIILTTRLTDLLKSKTRPCCTESVMDCIQKVFGTKNLVVRKVLNDIGCLEKFDQQFSVNEQEIGSNGIGKLRCYKCDELKDEWEITVDTDTMFCEFICEDCHAKKQKSKEKEAVKAKKGPVNIITDREKTPVSWDDLLQD